MFILKVIASGTGAESERIPRVSGARWAKRGVVVSVIGAGGTGEPSRARWQASECSAPQPHANKTLVSNLLPCGREQWAPLLSYAPYFMTCYSDGLGNFNRIFAPVHEWTRTRHGKHGWIICFTVRWWSTFSFNCFFFVTLACTLHSFIRSLLLVGHAHTARRTRVF